MMKSTGLNLSQIFSHYPSPATQLENGHFPSLSLRLPFSTQKILLTLHRETGLLPGSEHAWGFPFNCPCHPHPPQCLTAMRNLSNPSLPFPAQFHPVAMKETPVFQRHGMVKVHPSLAGWNDEVWGQNKKPTAPPWKETIGMHQTKCLSVFPLNTAPLSPIPSVRQAAS